MRDIHTVGWISKRYFRVTNLFGLVQQEFITEKEFDELQQAEDFLWLIRHHLHKIAKRNENRVLFDYQRLIAERIGYRDNSHPNAAVEQFMRDYYRYAMSNSTLSEMLTQHYYETLIEARLPDEQRPVQRREREEREPAEQGVGVEQVEQRRADDAVGAELDAAHDVGEHQAPPERGHRAAGLAAGGVDPAAGAAAHLCDAR